MDGYFSYNSSGLWLSFLLINCLHITFFISVRDVGNVHLQPRILWQQQLLMSIRLVHNTCVPVLLLAERCLFTSHRKPTFDLYLFPSSHLLHSSPLLISAEIVHLPIGFFYKTVVFFLFHDTLPPFAISRQRINHSRFGESQINRCFQRL